MVLDREGLLHQLQDFCIRWGVLHQSHPIPASSGKTNRHRLNRGGHRQANAALHRIVVVRLRHDERTQAYLTLDNQILKEVAEGNF